MLLILHITTNTNLKEPPTTTTVVHIIRTLMDLNTIQMVVVMIVTTQVVAKEIFFLKLKQMLLIEVT